MDPYFLTAPGRIDFYVWGERFSSYQWDGPVPGFSDLLVGGVRAVTEADAAAGHSLWASHGNINGISVSSVVEEGRPVGRIVTRDFVARRGSQSVGFKHDCVWLAPDGTCLVEDQRTVRITRGPSAGAILDLSFRLAAPESSAVTLGLTEDALVQARVAPALYPDGGGQLRSSEDAFGPDEIHGRSAAWCACNGVVQGETVGMAFLDHPSNAWFPSPWRCREDRILSPSPFPWSERNLTPGERLALRYRIVVHSGYVEAGWVQARMEQWLQETG